MRKITILLVLVILISSLFIGCESSKQRQYEEDRRVVKEELARRDRERERREANKREGALEIVKIAEVEIRGRYSYLEGAVVNNSNKNVEYFKVVAEYMDTYGNVVDTAYTNSGQTLRPGNQKRIRIMNKYGGNETKVNVIIEEVRYAD